MSVVASIAAPVAKPVGVVPRDCASCLLREPCGGHPLEIIRAIGCANYSDGQLPVDRSDMNPLDEERFWRLWDDVYGLLDFSISTIAAIDSSQLPVYVPLLQHPYSRAACLNAPIVALHLYQVFRKGPDGGYRCRFANGAQLRARYRLRPDTRIILCGVAIDRRLELFWAHHRKDEVGAQLAQLGLVGVTVPNFSFFTDVTRYQILRNRKRIVLVTERLSEAGVPVAPHLNALTPRDWEFWFELLRDHPTTSVVALEFQTGLSTLQEGRDALAKVADLQQKLGRLLHPILVGGAKHYLEAQALFSRFTVLDSRPFMEAQARRQLTGDREQGFRWTKFPTEKGEPIDRLFEANLALYPEKLKLPLVTEAETPWSDPAQLEMFG
jgi:hypothetical protein